MKVAGDTHFDVFEVIGEERSHVGIAFAFESLPGEDADAFRAHIERRARDLRAGDDVQEGGILTLFRSENGHHHATIVILADSRPAPLKAARRGKRGGKKAA